MRKILLVLFLLAQVTPINAQDPEPPAPPPSRTFDLRWDLLLRYEEMSDIPRNTGAPDFREIQLEFDRGRLQFRPGIIVTPIPIFTFEARAAFHENTKDNEDFNLGDGSFKIRPFNHLTYSGRMDNFEPDSLELDRLSVRVHPTPGLELRAGKFENPFDTTEATWDNDLQPEGLAMTYDFGSGIRSRVAAGAYIGTQLYGDESVILGGQYSLMGSETWPVTFDLSLGFYNYDNLEVWGRKNWRNNLTVGTGDARRYASDFEIGDVIFRLRSDRWFAPMEAHVEMIHNFGASDDGNGEGLEAGFRIGSLSRPGAWRFSYTYQDLDRDAVMTAFNGDDWWLHSWYRGHLARVGIGLWRDFAIQGTYMTLRHHEVAFDTTRVMVDLVKRY